MSKSKSCLKKLRRTWRSSWTRDAMSNMKSQTFNNVAGGINSIVVVIAIMVSGWWAYQMYDVLEKKKTADAQLFDLQKKIKGIVVINVEVTHKILSIQQKYITIEISVDLKNTGTRTGVIDWQRSSLFFRRVVFLDDDNEPKYGPVKDIPLLSEVFMVGRSTINPTQSENYKFITRLDEAGLYYLELAMPLDESQQEQAKEAGISSLVVDEGRHVARKYLYIEKGQPYQGAKFTHCAH